MKNEKKTESFICPVCHNDVDEEYASTVERRDGKGTITICVVCTNELETIGLL